MEQFTEREAGKHADRQTDMICNGLIFCSPARVIETPQLGTNTWIFGITLSSKSLLHKIGGL